MDLDILKLIVGILFGIYATLVIIDAYLMRQYIKDINAILSLPKQPKQRVSWYWFCIRCVLTLHTLRCNLALYRAVRMAEKCLSESKSTRT